MGEVKTMNQSLTFTLTRDQVETEKALGRVEVYRGELPIISFKMEASTREDLYEMALKVKEMFTAPGATTDVIGEIYNYIRRRRNKKSSLPTGMSKETTK